MSNINKTLEEIKIRITNMPGIACSLKNAIKLKELGIYQKSIFFYEYSESNNEYILRISSCFDKPLEEKDDLFSAFTLQEISEILFDQCYERVEEISYLNITTEVMDRVEGRYYRITNNITDSIIDEKYEVDARAELFIQFMERGLI